MAVRLKRGALERVVAAASLAPSLGNTQPARWHLDADGAVWLLADPGRLIKAGDPRELALRLAVGAALEGTVLALSAMGLGVSRTELFDRSAPPTPVAGYTPLARLRLGESAMPHPLARLMEKRFTWRGPFVQANADQASDLMAWARLHESLVLILDRDEIGRLAAHNDDALLRDIRDPVIRAETTGWMRLSPDHPDYARDGLGFDALGLSPLAARLGSFVLNGPLFPAFDAAGLVARLIAERGRAENMTAIMLFFRPTLESPLSSGRAYYYRLLELAEMGFQAWPMGALAGQPEMASEIRRNNAIHDGNRLIAIFRLGVPPRGANPRRVRLPVSELIV